MCYRDILPALVRTHPRPIPMNTPLHLATALCLFSLAPVLRAQTATQV